MSTSLSRAGLAAVAALLLASGAAVQAAPPAVGEDFKLLPANTHLLWVIQVDKALASDAAKKLRKEVPDIDKGIGQEARNHLGVDLANVERMTVGGNVKDDRPVMIVRCKNAVKAEDVLKNRSEPRNPGGKGTEFKGEKVGKYTMYAPGEQSREAFCVVDDKTILISSAKVLKPVLEAGQGAGLGAGLQPALKAAGDMDATVVMLMDLKAISAVEKLDGPPGVDIKKAVEGTLGAIVVVKVGPEVTVRGLAVCADAQAAEEVKKASDAALKVVGDLMKEAAKRGAPKELVDVPAQVKTSTKGTIAEATLSVKDDVAVAFIKAMFMASPQPPPPAPKPEK